MQFPACQPLSGFSDEDMMSRGAVGLSPEVRWYGAALCWGSTFHWGWLSAAAHKSDRGGGEPPGARPPSVASVPSFDSPLSLSPIMCPSFSPGLDFSPFNLQSVTLPFSSFLSLSRSSCLVIFVSCFLATRIRYMLTTFPASRLPPVSPHCPSFPLFHVAAFILQLRALGSCLCGIMRVEPRRDQCWLKILHLKCQIKLGPTARRRFNGLAGEQRHAPPSTQISSIVILARLSQSTWEYTHELIIAIRTDRSIFEHSSATSRILVWGQQSGLTHKKSLWLLVDAQRVDSTAFLTPSKGQNYKKAEQQTKAMSNTCRKQTALSFFSFSFLVVFQCDLQTRNNEGDKERLGGDCLSPVSVEGRRLYDTDGLWSSSMRMLNELVITDDALHPWAARSCG